MIDEMLMDILYGLVEDSANQMRPATRRDRERLLLLKNSIGALKDIRRDFDYSSNEMPNRNSSSHGHNEVKQDDAPKVENSNSRPLDEKQRERSSLKDYVLELEEELGKVRDTLAEERLTSMKEINKAIDDVEHYTRQARVLKNDMGVLKDRMFVKRFMLNVDNRGGSYPKDTETIAELIREENEIYDKIKVYHSRLEVIIQSRQKAIKTLFDYLEKSDAKIRYLGYKAEGIPQAIRNITATLIKS